MRRKLRNRKLYFSGAMGTMLQNNGLKSGELPEKWNISNAEVVQKIHEEYIKAGCNIIETNTFGANGIKYSLEGEFSLEKILNAAVDNAIIARERAGTKDVKIALDIGPTGKLIKPMGDFRFDEAIDIFKQSMEIGINKGVDLILIETMNDLSEARAALIAAKELTDIPVWITCVFNNQSRMLTGADPETMILTLESLGADAIGLNCSLSPKEMLDTSIRIINAASVPVIVTPNAGLPVFIDGETHFNTSPSEFANGMKDIALAGADILGGCCGTTPDHIKEMIKLVERDKEINVSTWREVVRLGDKLSLDKTMDCRENKELNEAIKEEDFEYILDEIYKIEDADLCLLSFSQEENSDIERNAIKFFLEEVQGQVSTPLMFSTEKVVTLEEFLRGFNGRPVINITEGLMKELEETLSLLRKYNPVINIEGNENRSKFIGFDLLSL